MTALQDLLEETKECHHSLLKQLFANCPVEVLQQMQLIRLRKNQNLISTYQTSNPVFVLLDGRLQAIEERVVDIPYSFTELHPVDIVGDYELFTGMEGHYVTLKTMEASCCARLRAASYLHWMKSDANALFLRTQMLMKELSVQTQLQRQYLFMDNRTRLLLFLLRSNGQSGGRIPATRERIAASIGCSVRTCNRIILTLSQEGFVDCIHGKLQISEQQRSAIKKELETSSFSF